MNFIVSFEIYSYHNMRLRMEHQAYAASAGNWALITLYIENNAYVRNNLI